MVDSEDAYSVFEVAKVLPEVIRSGNHEARPNSAHSERRAYVTWLGKMTTSLKAFRNWHSKYHGPYAEKKVPEAWERAIAEAKVCTRYLLIFDTML